MSRKTANSPAPGEQGKPHRTLPERAPEKPKRLTDYERTEPTQLDLFRFLDLKPQERQRYSNTIELYDFMPKYYWGKTERINGKFLETLEREFECRGVRYKIEIAPAVITDRDGVKRYYYPSKREELVEDALRKLATAHEGLFLDEMAGVTFTIHQLQQELKRNGHSYSKDQIKNALLVCARTNITVSSEDGAIVLVSNLFETLGLQTREDWQKTETRTKAFVRFNSLVTESIKQGTYRQLDYDKAMSYTGVVARQLHKRMSHHYTQASVATRYEIKLSTIIRDFGLAEYERPSQNLVHVLKALEEMQAKGVVLKYEVEKILDASNRQKLIDAKFSLQPHPFFAGAVTASNTRQKRIRGTLREDVASPETDEFDSRKRQKW